MGLANCAASLCSCQPHMLTLDFNMRNYIHFFAGGIFFLGTAVVVGLFRYTWLIDNLENLNLFFFASFLVASVVLVVLYFYVPFKVGRIKNDILNSVDESLKPLESKALSLADSSIQSVSNISSKIFDLVIEGRSRRLIIGGFLFIFATIIGSVGSILLFKQNALIKEQNTMLLKQYEGFIQQIDVQQQRWEKIDKDSFESQVVVLEREIISLNREVYTFAFDMAVLELELTPKIKHEHKISVRIFDLWELTANTIDTETITTKPQLEKAKLVLAQFEFFFSPVNQRIQAMRGYPKPQQKEMLSAMKGLLDDLLKELDDNKSNRVTGGL